MTTIRQLFQTHVAQTSEAPIGIEVASAQGSHITATDGKKYLDLISGISVSNVGHNNPQIKDAVSRQMDLHAYVMVYGEYIQYPQVALATLLSDNLPKQLDNVYFVNSGSEAVEGAMKLAKRYTGKHEFIAFKNAYHGSTHGALSLMDDHEHTAPFVPLLPKVRFLDFGDTSKLNKINERTAAVVIEPIQGEAGIQTASAGFFTKLRKRCDETGCLLIFDEIQTGLGRTGSLFYFEQTGIVPDVLLTAKAVGGGMPLGAFISSKEIMSVFTHEPVLGHITTFGGHAVCCAAGLASLEFLLNGNLIKEVHKKESHFNQRLQHPAIQQIRSAGLMMAIEFESYEFNLKVIEQCIKNGVITDWFLFADNCLRIAPPLIITPQEIDFACDVILKAIDDAG